MSDLKPCPFTKTRKGLLFTEDYYNGVVCHGIIGPMCASTHHASKEAAIEAWNNRPIEDELQSQIDRLTKERDELKHERDDARKAASLLHIAYNAIMDIVGSDRIRVNPCWDIDAALKYNPKDRTWG